ncbi:general stress protein [Planococcus lenghuensis]|uniref:Uncharacterized protein n=1 Tax=Planococcus lenghuensis TaxID=2213202 RepID=A0A1Q2L0K3_9BACL|nr:general stress protein [Planococcus lenghuensis]AQQ53961.1 hypothetical protein B0X71_13230 [Planococcus lenghuensis]
MKSNERLVEVIYTPDELDRKVEELKLQGYNERDLHILASNESELIQHVSDGTERFKSFYTDRDLNEERFRELNLTETDQGKFKDGLNRGGAVIYADHGVPRRDRINDTGTTVGDKFDDGRVIAAGTNFEEDETSETDYTAERIVIDSTDNRTETRRAEDNTSRPTPEAEQTQNDSRYVDDRYIEGKHIKDDDGIHGRNTAYALFDRHEERGDDVRHPDARIIDKDVQKGERAAHKASNNEEEHGSPIHPSSSKDDIEPRSSARTNHEPGLLRETEQEADRHQDHPYEDRNDGVNRSDDEFSPGNDPNLGPAPFGRDSEEQHLAETKREKRVVTDKRERSDREDDLPDDGRNRRSIRNDDLPPSSRPF